LIEIDKAFSSSIEAFDQALRVRKKNQNPREWAMTSENIAISFLSWSFAKNNAGRVKMLEISQKHFENALSVWEPVHTTMNWINSRQNLAKVFANLMNVSEITLATEYARRSISEFRAIQSILSRDQSPGDWGSVEENIGRICAEVGKRASPNSPTDWIDKSKIAFERAEEVFTENQLHEHLRECKRIRNSLGLN